MAKRRTGFVPKNDAEYRRMKRLQGMTFRVAMAIREDYTEDCSATVVGGTGNQLIISVKGAQRALLRAVFDRLNGVLMADYEIQPVMLQEMVQGVQTSWYDVVCHKPDTHMASPIEWCRLIARLMNRYLRCEVTMCAKYEQFLNL